MLGGLPGMVRSMCLLDFLGVLWDGSMTNYTIISLITSMTE